LVAHVVPFSNIWTLIAKPDAAIDGNDDWLYRIRLDFNLRF